MKKYIIYLMVVAAPLFVITAGINYVIDPLGYFHSHYVDSMIDIIKEGKHVTNPVNFNERAYKRKLAEHYAGQHFRHLIIGTSIGMQLSTDMFGPDGKVLNLGVSGASFQDDMAFYQICREQHITADTLIIATLPSLFNDTDSEARWRENLTYFETYSGIKSPLVNDRITALIGHDYSLLFSASYLKSAILTLRHQVTPEATDSLENEGYTERLDGSISYSRKLRTISADEVAKDAPGTPVRGEYLTDINPTFVEVFERFAKDCNKSGTELILFRFPLQADYYRKVCSESKFLQHAEHIAEVTERLHIPLWGNYDPAECSLTDSSYFLDAGHLKVEGVRQLLNQYR